MALSPDRLALVNGPDADGPDADGLYKAVVPLIPLTADSWPDRLAGAPPAVRAWAEKGAAKPFAAKPGSHLVLPGDNGPAAVLVGCSDPSRPWDWGGLPFALAEGTYRIDGSLAPDVANRAALGWALGAYRFEGYKAADRAPARLVWPEGADRDVVTATALSVFLARDLVNRPANHMGPAELAAAGEELAQDFGATYRVVVGDDLLKQGWPAVHAVGRASPREPRLIELEWGAPDAPRLALVGKGVCFDTGGLDLKTAAGMKLMKKDMGGAASVLALARLVMAQALPVRLHVLIPAVENSIAGDAYRPLDVIETRKGLGVEIFNTDAEGRVILADALFEAARHKPDLIIDCATLTGAARVALGTECPVIFCNDDGLADDLAAAARAEDDPLWRLPLFDDYRYQTESRITDLNNCPDGGFGGAITAALFLEAFVDKGLSWVHVDMMGYNQRARPGRPEGGEAGPIRALFACLAQRYGG